MGIRPQIEAALAATAERLVPGSGSDVARQFKSDLGVIQASSDNFDRLYANQEIVVASPAVFEAKRAEGDPVTFGKRHDGLVVVYSDSLIYVRGMGFGAREVKALKAFDITVEPITAVVDGASVPGLRIGNRSGKPKFAVAIAPAKGSGSPSEAAAVRDQIVSAIGAGPR